MPSRTVPVPSPSPSVLDSPVVVSRRRRRLARHSQVSPPIIMLAPTTAPTPIPALAPSDNPPLPSSSSSTTLTSLPVGLASAQYPSPLTCVQTCPSSQHPAPSAHLNCDVVQPEGTGVSNPVWEAGFVDAHFPSGLHSEPKPQQLPPRSLGHR
jgi:hypothetical protein